MVLPFFGIMKDGKAHSDAGCLFYTSSSHTLSISLMMVFLWIFWHWESLAMVG
jgi:hypothetical protein